MKIMGIILIFTLTLGLIQHGFANEQTSTTDVHSASDGTETEQTLSAQEAEYVSWANQFWESLDRQVGKISLGNGIATLDVPESFYYLNPTDAERVLTEVWGNPPGDGSILGMLFPADATPFDSDSWGVTIEYEQEGYVKDDDAGSIDYSELLTSMKKDMREESQYRVEQGYESIELVGWASSPFYDEASHKLHWAQEIKFGDQQVNTLNYNIRVLGRRGVLVLNFIAGMDQLAHINQELDQVLAMAEFDEGSRYADFNPSTDQVAAYGLGALITGKVLAKTGMLAALLMFLKKFGVLIIVGISALVGKLFKRG